MSDRKQAVVLLKEPMLSLIESAQYYRFSLPFGHV